MQREAEVVGPDQQRKFTIDLSKYEYTTGKIATDLDYFQIFVYAPEMIAIEGSVALTRGEKVEWVQSARMGHVQASALSC
jgi:hypothetical protein